MLLALVLLASAVVTLAMDRTGTAEVPGLAATGRTARLSWQAGPALPSPRSQAVAAVGNNDVIYVLGGSTANDPRAVYRLVPGAAGWSTAPRLDRDRMAPGVGTTGSGRIIVFGGLEEEALKSTIEYNIFGDHQDLRKMSTRRYMHAFATDSTGRVYAVGGLDNSGQLLTSVERYEHASNAWTPLAPLPEARYAFAAVSDGTGHILTFGGGTENREASVSDTVNRYDIATNTWTRAAPMPIATRDSAAVLGPDGRIYVIGGSSAGGPLSRVLVYDPSTDSWSDETPLPEALTSASVVVDGGGRLMVIGGMDAASNDVPSVWVSQSLVASEEPPVITSTPVTAAYVGIAYSYQVEAAGNPPPTFSLTTHPAGMEIEVETGLISWTPTADQAGAHEVTVGASNSAGHDDQTFTIDVSAEPPDTEAPSVPSGLTASNVTQTTLTLAWDASTDNVGVAGYRLYEYVIVNPFQSYWILRHDNIAAQSVHVTGLEPGSIHKYAVTAFDGAGNESARSATLEVTNLQPPTAYHPIGGSTSEAVYAIVGQLFAYDVDAIGVPVPWFELVAGPAGMTVDGDTGLVQWTPGAVPEGGTATATVRATNSEGYDDHTFSFPVYPAGSDLEPPSQVREVVVTDITSNGATLTWSPASDNVGVAGYYIKARKDRHGASLFIAGNSVGPGTTFTLASLEPATTYLLWVAAYDAAGNVASISGVRPARLTTLGGTTSLYLSLAETGSDIVGDATEVGDEDILSFDGMNFAMVFDGSDVGVAKLDLDALHIVDADTILMSFDRPGSIPGLGHVDDSDIVQFDATSLGASTTGSFSLFLQGSAVGLDTDREDVDAIELLPDGRLLISTRGDVEVPGVSGRAEDLLALTPATPGDYTSGTWAMYFDGSDIGEVDDFNGAAVVAIGDIYLTTKDDFPVSGVPGRNEDVFVCTPTSLGTVTACADSPALYFDGSAFGLSDNDLDAIDLP